MRNLTIKRTKSFVGCAGKVKVYIEDAISGDLTINGVLCRKIGVLKNGGQESFVIGEEAVRVFVIADTLSKEFCNDCYALPAGGEDVFLTGKNRFNPAAGNPFIFDNNDNEESRKHRTNGMRKGVVVLAVSLVVGILVGGVLGKVISGGLLNRTAAEKVFSDAGVNITLTEAFSKVEIPGYTVSYESREAAVFALKEPFTLMAGLKDYSLKQYGELVLQNNGMELSQLKTEHDLTWFDYEHTDPETKDTYYYFACVYKTADAFWLVQYATLAENKAVYADRFVQWAQAVSFVSDSI